MRKNDNVSPHDDEVADLYTTVERIRADHYPDLDAELVSSLLTVQQRYAEDRPEARRRTEQHLAQWVASHDEVEGNA